MSEKHPQGETATEAMLRKARQHYAGVSTALQEAEARLKADDEGATKLVLDLMRNHWKAFEITIGLEIELEKRNRERAGVANAYAVDLDGARAEIGRRLACLKART